MRLFKDKNECCGCGVCAVSCNQQAIKMVQDEEGFLYPEINASLCIGCGLCVKSCAFKSARNDATAPIYTYIAKNIDEVVRSSSQSGGAFSALSDSVLNKKGVVYGVSLDEDFCAIHSRAVNKEERDLQRGSKYIQSTLYPVLKQIKEDVKKDIPVIFTGTACQIIAVKKYLENIDCKNIYFVDILCHGVPSPMVWKKHLEWHQEKQGELIEKVIFRDKSIAGWHKHIETLQFTNGRIHDSSFINMFYEHYILRPSCYECPYSRIQRVADITIGDCWGVDKDKPEIDDNKGLSLILVNSDKGHELFNLSNESMEVEEVDLSKYMQRPLKESAREPYNRTKFWQDYKTKPYKYIIKKYATGKARKRNRFLNKIMKKLRR